MDPEYLTLGVGHTMKYNYLLKTYIVLLTNDTPSNSIKIKKIN